jgi:predicted nucleic acid-binding protein
MTTIVVDTSAVIAVINGEPEKDRLIELTKETSIVAPPSIDWEIGNAFSAMLKQSRISLSQAVEVVNIYQEIDLEILEIDLIEALKLAGRLKNLRL